MTSAPIRVLVVDDSVVVRRVLARALEDDPDFEHAGGAADGASALAKIDRHRPDVIVLDLEMPVMDGFDTLRHLRDRGIPTIVFSHLTAAGAASTLEALALGAVDFVLKPTSAQGIGLAEEYVAREVLPRLRAAARPREGAADVEASPAQQPPSTRRSAAAARVDAVVVAVSTGGPNALAAIIADLPPALPVPILIVQHMPAVFTTQLADRLDRIGTLPVHEAADGEEVRPGHVYVAPGGRHMTLARAGDRVHVALNDDPPENSCRPAGDVLFRSAAAVYGDALLGLVMTGMGRDGLRGAEAIVAAGGTVVAQDSASSVVDGMPSAVAGIAAAIVPLPDIAAEIERRVAR